MKIGDVSQFKALVEKHNQYIDEYKRIANPKRQNRVEIGVYYRIPVADQFAPLLLMMVLTTIRDIETEIAEIGGEVEAFDPAAKKEVRL